ncbi:hypothetical protein FRX31_030589 [Thalictrum thalictroides]|uniref:DUF4283 domain-containing protein n=1 Tax=Thalictrum thalictroides TaxID=46969 RepID=A0A7J6V6J7_THATH|nr:hypothetical protein FRX31_030589 [Thalictrum thalictroides]
MVADKYIYYFKFTCEEDKKMVLEMGSIFIGGKLFIVRPWCLEVEKDRRLMQTVPIWVKFTDVPRELWTKKAIHAPTLSIHPNPQLNSSIEGLIENLDPGEVSNYSLAETAYKNQLLIESNSELEEEEDDIVSCGNQKEMDHFKDHILKGKDVIQKSQDHKEKASTKSKKKKESDYNNSKGKAGKQTKERP